MMFPSLAELMQYLYLDPRTYNLHLYSTGRSCGEYFVWEGERLQSSKIRRFVLDRTWPFEGKLSALEERAQVASVGDLFIDGELTRVHRNRWHVEAFGKRRKRGVDVPARVSLGTYETADQGTSALRFAQTGRRHR